MAASLPPLSCPHCYTENEALAGPRCQQCGLHMMSEQAYVYLSGPVRPLWESLISWRETPLASRKVRDLRVLQPRFRELAPYRAQLEPLDAWLTAFEHELLPLYQEAERLRKTLLLHLALWLVLLLAPLMAWLLGANALLVSLLCLPVAGWTYLGLWEFSRKVGLMGGR